jgi:hypothetical protein
MTHLIKEFPDIMADVIRRRPETFEAAAFEWEIFTGICFGGSVHDCFIHTEIQDWFREYNKSSLEHVLKTFKQSLQYWFRGTSFSAGTSSKLKVSIEFDNGLYCLRAPKGISFYIRR